MYYKPAPAMRSSRAQNRGRVRFLVAACGAPPLRRKTNNGRITPISTIFVEIRDGKKREESVAGGQGIHGHAARPCQFFRPVRTAGFDMLTFGRQFLGQLNLLQ